MNRPLDGIRILELGMVFVLPAAILPLAALGADVIKVEAGKRPDSTRWGPSPDNEVRPDALNYGGHFRMLNRNKRGITLDLTNPRGRDLFLQLVAVSDVVAENFTPRVIRNLRLDYEALRAVNERIILLSSTGFGQSGPWSNYRAYGPNTEAVDGLMHVTGYPDGPPQRAGAGGLGVAFTDVAGAYFGTFAILAALDYRDRTGCGQWLDLSHYEAGVATIPEALLDFEMNGRVMSRTGNRDRWRAPQGAYRCSGNDRWVAISVATDSQFASLAREMGMPALASDERFATLLRRHANHDALDALISSWTAALTAESVEQRLQRIGVEATSVATLRDVWLDPQLRHRGTFQVMPPPAMAPNIGPRPFLRPSWKMSVSSSATNTDAPTFNQHTDEVLSELLGISEPEISQLESEGVISRDPQPGILPRTGVMDLKDLVRAERLREVDSQYHTRLLDWFSDNDS
ncbi:MAG: CoA transferase [Dehalococcoidia bacterium]|nr:CoA transferase [Dehalococcoidia bacterium]